MENGMERVDIAIIGTGPAGVSAAITAKVRNKSDFALIRHDDQFDYYNGAGVDVTFMGAGEIDPQGNVNATRLGVNPTGA